MASPQMAAASIKGSSTSLSNPNLTSHWVTVAEYATIMNRAISTIYQWLNDGTMDEFKIPVYKDSTGKWWIKVTA